MTKCININSAQYRELKRLSKLPEILLKAEIARYQAAHDDRFPNIDELPGANSREAIQQDLQIREDGTSELETILQFAQTSDIKEANARINDVYRDLDVELIPINNTVIVDIKDRPSIFNYVETPQNDFSLSDSAMFIVQSLEKMAKTMGINIKHTTVDALQRDGLSKVIPDSVTSAAFIYNGDIYVNTDIASADSCIHELMHILLGSMRFKNPELYFELVNTAEQFSNFDVISQQYPNRTRTDLLEEVFVEEYSKYLSGVSNDCSYLKDDIIYQINYNVNRILDSILMGDNSVSAIDDYILYNSSLRELATIVNSSTMVNTRHGFLEDSMIHRVMANVKQELLENGDLKEVC